MIEAFVYIVISCVCFAFRVSVSGLKNGIIYALKKEVVYEDIDSRLHRYIRFPHVFESNASVSTTLQSFFLLMAFARVSGVGFFVSLGLASLVVMACWMFGAPFHQRWINIGSGLPAWNPDEASTFTFRDTKIEIPKITGYGKWRKLQPVIGAALIALAAWIYYTSIPTIL